MFLNQMVLFVVKYNFHLIQRILILGVLNINKFKTPKMTSIKTLFIFVILL
jgi:hypothetical protein